MARYPLCSLCDTPAEWHGEIPRTLTFVACDLHRAVTDVDAEAVGSSVTWRALARDAGQLVALVVVIASFLLLPGCGAESDYDPLFIGCVVGGLLTLAAILVLGLTRLGRAFGIVETRDDVEMETDGVRP